MYLTLWRLIGLNMQHTMQHLWDFFQSLEAKAMSEMRDIRFYVRNITNMESRSIFSAFLMYAALIIPLTEIATPPTYKKICNIWNQFLKVKWYIFHKIYKDGLGNEV